MSRLILFIWYRGATASSWYRHLLSRGMPDLIRPVFPRKGKFLGPHRLKGGCLDQFGIHLVVMDFTNSKMQLVPDRYLGPTRTSYFEGLTVKSD